MFAPSVGTDLPVDPPALLPRIPGVVLLGLAAPILAAVGVALAALGERTSPAAMVVVVLVLPVAALALARPAFAPVLVLLAIPVAEADLPGPVPLQLIDLAVVAAVVLIALSRLARGSAPLRWVPAAWWAVGLVVAAGLSLTVALDPGAAGKQVLVLGAGVLLALGIVAAVDDLDGLRLLVAAAVAVGTGVCLATLPSAGALRAELDGAVVDNRATGVFVDPNELGCFAALTLLLALGFAVGTQRPVSRALAALGIAAGLAALVLSLSRGAWFGSVMGVAVFALLVPSVRRRLVAATLAGALLVAAAATLAPDNEPAEVVSERLGTIEDPLGNPYDERPTMWRVAVDLIGAHPLLGVGPASFPRAYAAEASPSVLPLPVHAHSLPLTVAVELGLAGGLLVLGLAVTVARQAVRAARRLRRHGDEASAALMAGAAGALAVFVGQGVVDYTLRNATIMLMAWTLVGVVLAGARLAAPRRDVRAGA